jgi:hypothetical protein
MNVVRDHAAKIYIHLCAQINICYKISTFLPMPITPFISMACLLRGGIAVGLKTDLCDAGVHGGWSRRALALQE